MQPPLDSAYWKRQFGQAGWWEEKKEGSTDKVDEEENGRTGAIRLNYSAADLLVQ